MLGRLLRVQPRRRDRLTEPSSQPWGLQLGEPVEVVGLELVEQRASEARRHPAHPTAGGCQT